MMSFLVIVALGMLAGYIGSKLVRHNTLGKTLLLDVLLGLAGAVIGGISFHTLESCVMNDLNHYSLIIALVGAILYMGIYHTLFRRV
jgi:uncharacterized membrane protein YeaQ/YmgE (transglycosylase-associated protein family)